jgi:hypothetical protein
MAKSEIEITKAATCLPAGWQILTGKNSVPSGEARWEPGVAASGAAQIDRADEPGPMGWEPGYSEKVGVGSPIGPASWGVEKVDVFDSSSAGSGKRGIHWFLNQKRPTATGRPAFRRQVR